MNVMNRVADILREKGHVVLWIEATSSVFDAIRMMVEADVGALLVKDGEEISGIFTERNYFRRGTLKGRSDRETQVRELVSSPVICVTSDTGIEECMALMTEHRIRYAPVVEGGALVGMISIGDVVKFQSTQQSFQLKLLNDYITAR